MRRNKTEKYTQDSQKILFLTVNVVPAERMDFKFHIFNMITDILGDKVLEITVLPFPKFWSVSQILILNIMNYLMNISFTGIT